MTTERFESIKHAYNEAKTKADQAEGAREQLLHSLKEEFDITSMDELEECIAEAKKEQESLEHQIADLETELEAITDWNAVGAR